LKDNHATEYLEKKQAFREKANSSPKLNEKKVSYDDEEKKETNEKNLKFKKKLDLDLDHIEEMPINYESSSKRIDLNEMNFNKILAEGVNEDSIKENSDDKITVQSKKK